MRIFTSYYGRRLRDLPVRTIQVGISAKIPGWFEGPVVSYLAPSTAIRMMGVGKFEEPYRELIKKRRYEIEKRLRDFEGNDIIMLCYEKDRNECHRKIAAEVLEEWGYDVRGEWGEKEEVNQPSLCF